MPRIGHYQVHSLLGAGAFGEVLRATFDGPRGFRKEVALKRIHPHLTRNNPELVNTLVNEARIGGLLRHPNIVETYELYEEDDVCIIAMEYLEGAPLDLLLRRSAERSLLLPTTLALEMVEQVCEGLHHAHTWRAQDGRSLDLVHRDLKPANLFLTPHGLVKIMDFGIAKALSNVDPTTHPMAKGTPPYMSPEQIRGDAAVTAAADIFALGAILYEMVTCERLFQGENHTEIMYRILEQDPGEKVAILDTHMAGLSALVLACVDSDPDLRPKSALALAESLAALRVGQDPLPRLRSATPLLFDPKAEAQGELPENLAAFCRDLAQGGWNSTERQLEAAPWDLSTEVNALREAGTESKTEQGVTAATLTSGPQSSGDTVLVQRQGPRNWLPWALLPLALLLGLTLALGGGPLFSPSNAPNRAARENALLTEKKPAATTLQANELIKPEDASTQREKNGASALSEPAKPPVVREQSPKDNPSSLLPTEEGTLLVKTSPWSYLEVDGQALGKTPWRGSLSSGRHGLILRCGTCPEETLERRTVTVEAGAVLRIDHRFQPSEKAP